ncbi:DUF58 domain-containing protein [Lysinibacillus sp. 54212]|uniref:DUF58 domain-containing protein n=1 Tax=Lysinibacillus sp. 54212 TaxID=3119829 RepID=UPI002FCB5A99
MKRIFQYVKKSSRFITIIGLLLFAFCFAMFQGGFVSWFIFFTVLPFLLYSFLLSLVPLQITNVRREMDQSHLVRGDTVNITVRFENKSRFPIVFLVVKELDTDERLYRIEDGHSGHLFLVGFKRKFEWTYSLEGLKRGEHQLSALEFTFTDFFGWTVRKKLVTEPHTVMVYPKTIDMKYASLQMQYDQGVVASKYSIVKDTSMVTGVRDYQAGDRFSWIHWKSFAKSGNLKTKEFEDRQSQSLFVCIDRATTEHFEDVVDLTGSIMKAIVKRNGDVAFLSGGENRVFYPIVRTDIQLEKVMHHLAIVKPDAVSSMESVLRSERQLNNSILLVITGKLTDELKHFLMDGSKYARAVVCFVVVTKEQYKRIDESNTRFGNSRVIYLTPEMFSQAFTEVNKP